MADADAIVPYVRAWVAARARGQDPAAADLCRDRPELVSALAKRLTELRGTPSGPNPLGTLGSGRAMPPLPGQSEPDSAAAYPDRVGDYQLLGILGRGGMGAVFRAEDLRLGRQVAVKLILPDQAGNPTARARFLREARAQAGVQNDHVVPIYQAGEQNGILFIAMPLLLGETLRERLEREPLLPLATALKIGREVADGLSAAHAKGVIHRDVKPGNIWLEGELNSADPAERFRRCRVLDFGLARHAEAPQGRVTINRELLGTPAYMSPEQSGGAEVDFRSDLFSLGTLLYELSTGIQPFDDANPINSLVKLATYTPPAAHSANRAVPQELSDLISRMMSRNPAGRPESSREVVAALRRIESGVSVSPVLLAPPPKANDDFPSDPLPKKIAVIPQALPQIAPTGPGSFVPAQALETQTWQEPKRTRRGSKILALALGIGLAMAFLTGGLIVLTQTDLFSKPIPDPKQREPDPKPIVVAPVEIRVKIRPTGAALRPISDVSFPIAPGPTDGEYWIQLKPDQRLTVRAVHEGYTPKEFVVDASRTVYDIELLIRLPETVRVTFKGLPAGAAVKFLDDPGAKREGNDYIVRAGTHRVEISAKGYETRALNVEPPAASADRYEVPVSLVLAGPPKAYSDGIGIDFVLIPKGVSTLGFENPPEKQLADQPIRIATISKPYYLGKYEVTRGQFRKFHEATDHKLETDTLLGGVGYVPGSDMWFEQNAKFDWKNVGFAITDNHPVVNVSWNDAQAFCVWMSKQEKRRYRLPTEAEWEHAARAGTTTRFYFGNDEALLVKHANVADKSTRTRFNADNPARELKGFAFDDGFPFLAPVGKLDPNPHGLHDVYGNALELCEDWFGDVVGLPLIDPKQTEEHPKGLRVARGGSFISGTSTAVLMRHGVSEELVHVQLGFRVLVEVP